MAIATQFEEIIDSFHSSFAEKTEIPSSLEMMWLKKAIAEYGVEIEPLYYNEECAELEQYN